MHGRADDKKPRARNFRSALWLFVKLSYFNFLITSNISIHISISTAPFSYFKLYTLIFKIKAAKQSSLHLNLKQYMQLHTYNHSPKQNFRSIPNAHLRMQFLHLLYVF